MQVERCNAIKQAQRSNEDEDSPKGNPMVQVQRFNAMK